MNLDELRGDCARKQKKGIHFILASVIIWSLVLIVHLTGLPVLTKNLLTFCCTAPLMPLAFLLSKVLHIPFQDKNNPLSSLGLLFSLNQLPYLLIVMWVYPTVPEKMLMVFAMVFGAHLMPFGWLYQSRAYTVLSVAIPLFALIAGMYCPNWLLALMMLAVEVVFSILLYLENRK